MAGEDQFEELLEEFREKVEPLARAAAELTANYVAGPYEVVELDAGHWLPETEPDAVADGILARVRAS